MKKLVYDEKYIPLKEYIDILKGNWDNNEDLRQLVRNRITYYGNDDDEADAMMQRVFNDYTSIVNEVKFRNGVYRPCGISTFGREIDWRMQRAATAEGSRRGDILATNCSPTPGSDKKGPTSVINSYCKLDFSKSPNGATLELKILPASVKGDNGIKALMGLAKSFCHKNGFYMHIDVVDSAMLIDAQKHPGNYRNLPVRVAGWSARFTTLSKDWQDMVIQRTQQIV
jgi:Pyruvate-formate lyase